MAIHELDDLFINLHPGPGEDAEYLASSGSPLTQDYALVSLTPV